jgi:hypothetical protein
MNSVPRVPSYEDVLPVIYKAMDELNQQRPRSQRLPASPDCVFYGDNGHLDSLELSNFIVLTEQLVQETFGAEIDLSEDDPFSPEAGHMRTAGTLTSHIVKLLHGQA